MGEVVSGGGSGSIDRAIASKPMLVWRRGNGGPGLGVVVWDFWLARPVRLSRPHQALKH